MEIAQTTEFPCQMYFLSTLSPDLISWRRLEACFFDVTDLNYPRFIINLISRDFGNGF